MQGDIVLSVKNLSCCFYTPSKIVEAVGGVSFDVRAGRIMAVVGESGCGKTATAMSICGLLGPSGKVVEGEILLGGRDLGSLTREQFRRVRGREMAMIFQDPVNALNPVLTVGTQIIEAITAHRRLKRHQALNIALEAMEKAGLSSPGQLLGKYPFQLSGGMCQRVMIAIALAMRPALLIADEPTTALDVTIQAQILEELTGMKEKYGTGVMLITHDLGVVAEVADEVCIMKAGVVVETGNVYQVFKNPAHPYTRELIESIA